MWIEKCADRLFQTYFTSSSPPHISYFSSFIFLHILHISYSSYFFCGSEMCRQVIPDIFHLIFSYSYFRQELHYCHIFMNLDWMGNSSNILQHNVVKYVGRRKLKTLPGKCKEFTLNAYKKSPSAEEHEDNG